jgi:SpoVK/Ycf46/Vps4 family AAA+-type ATPase
MGYLICGRIGTGKTFLVECWAGELGIPCVVFKNFRDKWQGATEGNLERIFNILHALGQVVVFVDEADQATGKRGGGDDSGVSGRVYSMLAKEMSDTRNRGKILWVFATSRPDLVEVDLKRQGRLDVHIPLFPPQDDAERNALFRGIAKKLKIDPKTLPGLPPGLALGGNELEGVLIRARRLFDLQEEGAAKRPFADVVRDVLRDVRASAETTRLEFMDLIAVKECTDARFLPEAYRKMKIEDVERRIRELEALM